MQAAGDRSLQAKQAELILAELDGLPTLPSVATRLMAITGADDADLKEIIRLIEMDPALTARILSLCSRASAGVSRQVATVERAVVLLGLHAVQAAVLSVQVVDWMGKVSTGEGAEGDTRASLRRRRAAEAAQAGLPKFDHVGFWRHSIAVACAAELIVRELSGGGRRRDDRTGEAFVAGLMHDLGKPALALALPRAYGRIIDMAEQRQADIAEIERAVIGIDHHSAGKRLAERWNLPPAVRDAMWLHNQPAQAIPDAASKRLVGVVGLADALCRRLHLGWSGNYRAGGPAGSIEQQCLALDIDPAKLEALTPTVLEELSARSEALGLAQQPEQEVLLESVLNANRQLGRLNRELERRSRAAEARARILKTISAFHAAGAPGRTPRDVLSAIARSAADLLGTGFYAALAQTDESDERWTVMRFAPDGSLTDADRFAPPLSEHNAPTHLTELTSEGSAIGGSMTLARWLDTNLGPAARGKTLRFVPLAAPGRSSAAVLIHDRLLGDLGADTSTLEPLVATWAGAFAAAADVERSGSLGEQLAEANRVLAETQRKLAETESMARLGQLTAGAAHEMNNPLAVISGRAQTLEASAPDDRSRAAAAAIVSASRRLSDLITRLHVIATPPTPRPGATSIQDLMALIVRDAKEQTGARAARAPVPPIRVVIEAPLPPAMIDREMLRRAVLELVVNAIEAGSRDGVEIRICPEADDGGDVLVIAVKDTGRGMDEHALRHAFDPFFSQKPAGRQTGLGLPTARRLIEAHGGTVQLQSKAGVGTTATVRLPRWRASEEELEEGPGPIARAA